MCLLLLKLVLSVKNFALQLVNWSLSLPFRFFQIISFVQLQDILCKPLFVAFLTLREKCPYSEFFWSVFSRVRTEQGLQHRCFPVNIVKFIRKPILKNICERLLLYLQFDCQREESTISTVLYSPIQELYKHVGSFRTLSNICSILE